MAAHDDDDFFDDPRRRHTHNTDLDNPVFKQLDQLTRNKRSSQSSTSSSSRRSSASLAKPPSRRSAGSPSGSESESTTRASSSDSDSDSKEASVQIFLDKSKSSASDGNSSTSSSNGRIVQATVPSVTMQSDSDSDQSDSDTYTDESSSHDGEKNKELNDFDLKADVRSGSSKSASIANGKKSNKSSSAEFEHQESMDHLSINDSVSDGSALSSSRVKATSAKQKRKKSASQKRGQSKSMPSGSTEERLANNKQLLKEVLDIDSQYRSYSRPSSASSTSSHSRLQRPRSGAVEIPYRWRRNYTFTDDRVWQIEQENQRLLKNIRTTNAEISRCNNSKGTVGFDKRAAGELIRTKKLQELEAKNLAMLRRIQSIQPSPDVDRDVLLNEYRRQQIAYHGGPSRLIWTTHSRH